MKRSFLRRTALLLAAAVATVIAGQAPASADAFYPRANLDVLSCYVFDDPVNYGDGIDWWKLRFTYTNNGYKTTPSFTVNAVWVWDAANGNESLATYTQAPMARNATVTRDFWVTDFMAKNDLWRVALDTSDAVLEFDSADNYCDAFSNP